MPERVVIAENHIIMSPMFTSDNVIVPVKLHALNRRIHFGMKVLVVVDLILIERRLVDVRGLVQIHRLVNIRGLVERRLIASCVKLVSGGVAEMLGPLGDRLLMYLLVLLSPSLARFWFLILIILVFRVDHRG